MAADLFQYKKNHKEVFGDFEDFWRNSKPNLHRSLEYDEFSPSRRGKLRLCFGMAFIFLLNLRKIRSYLIYLNQSQIQGQSLKPLEIPYTLNIIYVVS